MHRCIKILIFSVFLTAYKVSLADTSIFLDATPLNTNAIPNVSVGRASNFGFKDSSRYGEFTYIFDCTRPNRRGAIKLNNLAENDAGGKIYLRYWRANLKTVLNIYARVALELGAEADEIFDHAPTPIVKEARKQIAEFLSVVAVVEIDGIEPATIPSVPFKPEECVNLYGFVEIVGFDLIYFNPPRFLPKVTVLENEISNLEGEVSRLKAALNRAQLAKRQNTQPTNNPKRVASDAPKASCLRKQAPTSSVRNSKITLVFPVRNICDVCIEARAHFERDGQRIGIATNTFGPQFLIPPNQVGRAVATATMPFKGSVHHSITLQVVGECKGNYNQKIRG